MQNLSNLIGLITIIKVIFNNSIELQPTLGWLYIEYSFIFQCIRYLHDISDEHFEALCNHNLKRIKEQ